MTRTEALRKVYKKVTNEEAPVTANTITEVLVALADKYSGDEPVTANTITDALVALADNYEGGGGGSWVTLTEESVTTVAGDYGNKGIFSYSLPIDADTIKVTFDGTEYTCVRRSTPLGDAEYGALWVDNTQSYDWTEYPFYIAHMNDNVLSTETAGTYSIKIEAPAESGSSDFSTATVTVTGGTTSNDFPVYDNGTIDMKYMVNESATVVIGADGLVVSPPDGYASVSGAIQSLGKAGYLITGDCTITIS